MIAVVKGNTLVWALRQLFRKKEREFVFRCCSVTEAIQPLVYFLYYSGLRLENEQK